jgi:hypothetical protein
MMTSKHKGNARLPIVEIGQKSSSEEMGKYKKYKYSKKDD